MIEHNIQHHIDTHCMCFIHQFPEFFISKGRILPGCFGIGAKPWLYSKKIKYAIAAPVIIKPLGVDQHRRKPDSSGAQFFQVGQPLANACKVATLVSIAGKLHWDWARQKGY